MKKNSLILTLLLMAMCMHVCDVHAKKEKNEKLAYDIVCAGSGQQGHYIVEVSAYVEKPNQIGKAIVEKCAVHGVLFKGFSGGQGCTAQRPLAGSALTEQQHPEFFGPFFQDGGGYGGYVTMVSGSVKTQRVEKLYKVTAVVDVSKEQLRKDLEKAGVIKGLTNGF